MYTVVHHPSRLLAILFLLLGSSAFPEDVTALLKDISYVGEIESFGDFAVLRGSDGMRGEELFITDGTTAGTTLLLDIIPGPDASVPAAMAVLEARCYFSAVISRNGPRRPWVTDGTAAGTWQIQAPEITWDTAFPRDFLLFQGAVYFVAQVDGARWGIFKVSEDATQASSIRLFNDLYKSDKDSYVHFANARVYKDMIIFNGVDGQGNIGLWRSDGTAAGTHELKELTELQPEPFPPLYRPARRYAELGGMLYFITDPARNIFENTEFGELWRTDGTVAGTSRISIVHNSFYPMLAQLTASGGKLFFTAQPSEVIVGNELWVSDGTSEGTHVLNQVFGGQGGILSNFVDYNGTLLFRVDDTDGNYLWRSDGTAVGTYPIKQIAPVTNLQWWDPSTVWNDILYFGTTKSSHAIWRTDGTEAGTVPVEGSEGLNEVRTSFEVVGNLVLYGGDGELWAIYGQEALSEAALAILENAEALDTNDDDILTRDEVEAGMPDVNDVILDGLDENDDGIFDLEELINNAPSECDPLYDCIAQTFYEVGDNLCLSVPCPVSQFSSFQWMKDGVSLVDDEFHIQGATTRTLEIFGLVLQDAGSYSCIYNTGAKAPAAYNVYITVAENVPVSGAVGLTALTLLSAVSGAVVLRRRK
jgi:ELWxxDGT repeat protein